MISDMEEYS
jgi:hypothetical protein